MLNVDDQVVVKKAFLDRMGAMASYRGRGKVVNACWPGEEPKYTLYTVDFGSGEQNRTTIWGDELDKVA